MDLEQALPQDPRRSRRSRSAGTTPGRRRPSGGRPRRASSTGSSSCRRTPGRGATARATSLGRERLAGDDVRADGDDPPTERRHDPVRVAVRGHEHVAGLDRPARRLDDEPPVGLAPDRVGARAPSCRLAPARIGGGGQPGEVAPGMEQRRCPRRRAPRSTRRCRSPRGSGRAARPCDDDADRGEAVAGVLELGDVRRGVRELEVTDLAEVAVDRLVGDQPLDELVRVERLAVERRPASRCRSAR